MCLLSVRILVFIYLFIYLFSILSILVFSLNGRLSKAVCKPGTDHFTKIIGRARLLRGIIALLSLSFIFQSNFGIFFLKVRASYTFSFYTTYNKTQPVHFTELKSHRVN